MTIEHPLFMWAKRVFAGNLEEMAFDGVKIDRRGVLLLIEVLPLGNVVWIALGERTGELSSEGVVWRNGRLTDSGGGLAKLHAWLQRMEMSFGEVELDLRRATDWHEERRG